MPTKWDKYTFSDDSTMNSSFTLATNITPGRIEPWDLGTNPGMPNGGHYGGFPCEDSRKYCGDLGYSDYGDILGDVLGVWKWRKSLADGTCLLRNQIHEMSFVPLPRLTGEKMFQRDGKPLYCGYISRAECLEHFIIPLFDTKGGCRQTHYEDMRGSQSINNVCVRRPPRIIIRHTRANSVTERYVTDICLGSQVRYIGTDTTLEKAVARSKRLIEDIMLMPEDLPDFAREMLSRDYYGLVFGKVLPMKEQMIISDYWLALRIASWESSFKSAALLESQRRSLWECPQATMHKALWTQRSIESCYGREHYKEAQRGMRALIPLLTGKYTKAVGNIFKKALLITEEDYDRKELHERTFGEFWP